MHASTRATRIRAQIRSGGALRPKASGAVLEHSQLVPVLECRPLGNGCARHRHTQRQHPALHPCPLWAQLVHAPHMAALHPHLARCWLGHRRCGGDHRSQQPEVHVKGHVKGHVKVHVKGHVKGHERPLATLDVCHWAVIAHSSLGLCLQCSTCSQRISAAVHAGPADIRQRTVHDIIGQCNHVLPPFFSLERGIIEYHVCVCRCAAFPREKSSSPSPNQ